MTANLDCPDTIELVRITDAKDFANLMPRPGWNCHWVRA